MADQRPADHETALYESLPIQVKEQPDPMLQMSTGRVGAGGLTLFGVVVIVILSVVMYGLNGSNSESGAPPPAAKTASAGGTGAAATPAAPQKTNNSKG
jgi:hypothetical protein